VLSIGNLNRIGQPRALDELAQSSCRPCSRPMSLQMASSRHQLGWAAPIAGQHLRLPPGQAPAKPHASGQVMTGLKAAVAVRRASVG
jgi:hypothetical protein